MSDKDPISLKLNVNGIFKISLGQLALAMMPNKTGSDENNTTAITLSNNSAIQLATGNSTEEQMTGNSTEEQMTGNSTNPNNQPLTLLL